MKSIIQIIILSAVFTASSHISKAQKSKLDTLQIEVAGVCGMCKERIENAAYIRGVKFVEWSRETHILTAIYRKDKITEEEIHEAVIESGHDTEKLKASEEAYQKLPDCCAYRDGIKDH